MGAGVRLHHFPFLTLGTSRANSPLKRWPSNEERFMDRRQLLYGVTALGIASRFDLNDLLNAQTLNTSTSKTAVSDRERDGLRGPVNLWIEHEVTREYDPDGKILELRGVYV